MKRIAIILTFILSGLTSHAEYRSLQLFEMIIKAEKIVYGTVVELDSSYFTLKIEGSLTSDSGILKVERFSDWACAERWGEYAVGQRLLLFLTNWEGKLLTMSAGNEGELPIYDNDVFINSLSLPVPMPPLPEGLNIKQSPITFECSHQNVYEEKFHSYKMELDEFLRVSSIIRNCFDFTYTDSFFEEQTNWKITCEQDALSRELETSELIEWVYWEATEENKR